MIKIFKVLFFFFRLILDLEFFKIRNQAVAPFVASRIEQTRAFLQNGINNPPFSVEIT